jgi:hypothetical protein
MCKKLLKKIFAGAKELFAKKLVCECGTPPEFSEPFRRLT